MDLKLSLIAAALCLVLVSAHKPHTDTDLGAMLDKADMSNQDHLKELYEAWEAKHAPELKAHPERSMRMNNVLETAKMVKKHNEEQKMGIHTWTMGLNHLSHKTVEEFSQTLGHRPRDSTGATMNRKKRQTNPASIDYTTLGYVTTPMDQGQCGCCWTFAAAEGIEGAYFKKTGKLLAFSKQQFVECVPGFQGCNGGAAAAAYDYAQTSGGVATEASYPYTSQNNAFGACKASSTPLIQVSPNYINLPTGDDASLMSALVQYGPIPTTVATAQPWMSYASGVMNPTTACDPAGVNHAVLIVGYGTDPVSGLPFWKIKNSWSTSWGESGFLRLSRAVPNSCGVSTEPIAISSV